MKKKRMKINFNKTTKSVLLMGLIAISLVIISVSTSFESGTKNVNYSSNYLAHADVDNGFVYLSDLSYLTTTGMSQNGWEGHTIQKDKNQEGGSLSLIVNGEKRTYVKGISIHGRGWATYDISELSSKYTRFTAKLGVDASRGNNGSIFFRIYASADASTWDTLLQTDILSGNSESVNVDVNIEGYKYLRIYVDPNGSNAADHGTIANAKLVTTDYENKETYYDKLHKLEYYDEILREHDAEYNYENNYRTILEREIVNKIGYWTIQNMVELTPEIIDTFDWILSNDRILEEVIEVGEISRTTVFMEVLSNLYHTYRADLDTDNGQVYERMMIGLAAAYSTDPIASPLVYNHTTPNYDYIARYARVKQLFTENKFLHTDWFKEYHVEFMRSIMQDALRDDETMWFSNYVRVIKNGAMGPYSYMGYVKGNFVLPAYFEESNKETFDKKFHLSEFDVPYGDKPTARYWMVFQHGGICWNLARTGQSVQKTLGLPSTGLFQPSHEAYLLYTKDSQGRGFWYVGNNNYGWGRSSTTWYGGKPYRLLFNWGKKSFVNHQSTASAGGTNSGYQYLAQANLNRYDEYKKSLYLNLVANSYTDNQDKIDTYKKALESIELNLDSYDYLIQTYKKMGSSVTNQDWYALALQIIDAYTFYPQAMYDLLRVIKPYLSGPNVIDVSLKERTALERASRATNTDIWQDLAARELANAHLGKTQEKIASFSFDGANAGKIIINSAYAAYDFGWHYSLDGGQTKSEQILDHSFQLSKEEIAKITADDDIRIYIDGMPGDAYAYTIDIGVSTLPSNLYGNDLENRVVGVGLTFEWRNSDDEDWTSYSVASPNNTGNKTLQVRVGATGSKLPSEARTFTFTEDNQPNTRKYVPVSHLSVHAYSTQSKDAKRPYYAPNAIDGNLNTFWHTDFADDVRDNAIKPFITVKLDKPRYISAIEFQQTLDQTRPTDPDPIKNARIYVSEDGENWTEAGKIENCPQDNDDLRVIDFDESIYGEYIKIELDTYNMFASIAMVNVFQDLTKNPRPTAGIGYSTTSPTRENVIARLVNVSVANYEITSAGGDTHIFTENGSFTFTFVDKDTGLEGTSVATVDWIDRTAPVGTIEFSKTSPTNSTVIATLKTNETVRVTNNGGFTTDEYGNVYDEDGNKMDGYTIDENGNLKDANGNIVTNVDTFTYEFMDNGEFTFEFVDRAGNKGTATAKVTWIDHDIPEATISYDKDALTNQNVTVTAKFSEEVVVMNNGGSHSYTFTENGEFTFEFRDLAGNINRVTATVDWIDKEVPTAELQYEKVGDKVIVRVVNPSKDITFKSGNGIYEFTTNGNYDIIFYDKVGNMGKVTAVITGLDTEQEKPEVPNEGDNTGENGNQGGNTSNNQENTGNTNNTGNNNKPSTSKPGNTGSVNNENYNVGNKSSKDKPSVDNPESKTDDKVDADQKDTTTDKEDSIKDDDIGNQNETDQDTNKEKAKQFNFINIIFIAICAALGVAIVGVSVVRKMKNNG